jgi:hypothetical protein
MGHRLHGAMLMAAAVMVSIGGSPPAGAADDAPVDRQGTPGPDGAATAAQAAVTYRYQVAVAGVVSADLEAFADEAGAVLADPRGWSLGGALGFERSTDGGDFTLWLAAPAEIRRFSSACSRHYSCRAGDNIVVNDLRWAQGSRSWPGPLEDYRRYVVNHELGHWLGEAHSACPGPGLPAPVMMQQSKGLDGCGPGAWPLPAELASVAARHLPPGG